MKKMMMVCIALALAGALGGAPVYAADAAESAPFAYGIQVNGTTLEQSGCLMVPMEPVAAALGFTVSTLEDGRIRIDIGRIHTDVTLGEDRYHLTTSNPGLEA